MRPPSGTGDMEEHWDMDEEVRVRSSVDFAALHKTMRVTIEPSVL